MYSENVIFMDGEFTELSENGTQFISIALVKPNGDSYFAINADYDSGNCTEWVKENILRPLYIETVHGDARNELTALDFHKVFGKSKSQIAKEIKSFVGDSKPYLVADVNQFDWMGICGIFGIWNVPFFYIPIDFASILWGKGIDPDVNREEFAKEQGIDVSNFKKHNALDDAKMLKALYMNIISELRYEDTAEAEETREKYKRHVHVMNEADYRVG